MLRKLLHAQDVGSIESKENISKLGLAETGHALKAKNAKSSTKRTLRRVARTTQFFKKI